jgi:hypothetical protein
MKNFNDLMQLALPVLMEIPKPRLIDEGLIASCEDYGDAIRLCLDKRVRRIRESEIAEYLGFRPPHLAKVKNGQGYLTSDQELVLQHLCSNWAIGQYADMRKKQIAELIDSPEAEIMRLRARVALLESKAA